VKNRALSSAPTANIHCEPFEHFAPGTGGMVVNAIEKILFMRIGQGNSMLSSKGSYYLPLLRMFNSETGHFCEEYPGLLSHFAVLPAPVFASSRIVFNLRSDK
jgi:hypothetical protein